MAKTKLTLQNTLTFAVFAALFLTAFIYLGLSATRLNDDACLYNHVCKSWLSGATPFVVLLSIIGTFLTAAPLSVMVQAVRTREL